MGFKKVLVIFLLVAVIFFSFGFGFWFGKISILPSSNFEKKLSERVLPILESIFEKEKLTCPACPPEEIDFSLFWEAYHILKEKFVNKEKLSNQKIIYGAISGMLKFLEDPYTVFLSPEETKKFEEDISGVFEGVGMEIGIKKGQLQVVAPLEGTPAQKAGLRAGDKIIKINETSTMDLTIDEAVNLIRGPKGTEVTLTILREGWEAPKEFKIIRDIILVPSLTSKIIDNDIVYLKIFHFSAKTSSDFAKEAVKILKSPKQKIILDLRNNPGGLLIVVQDVAGWFLKKGELVTIEDFGPGKEKKEYRANGPGTFSNYPLVILLNQGSASGAEILAGALRDNRGIKIIGEPSFGKGSVQEQVELSDDSSLKITVAKWLTPKGETITDKGLEPDFIVKMTEKDDEEEKDPQLEKALEVIKNL